MAEVAQADVADHRRDGGQKGRAVVDGRQCGSALHETHPPEEIPAPSESKGLLLPKGDSAKGASPAKALEGTVVGASASQRTHSTLANANGRDMPILRGGLRGRRQNDNGTGRVGMAVSPDRSAQLTASG